MVPLSIFDGFVEISVRSKPVAARSFGVASLDGKIRARSEKMPIIVWSVRK
jgi:hypothetical protein